MEIFKRRPKFTYSFCAVCMQIIKENVSDVNASYIFRHRRGIHIYGYGGWGGGGGGVYIYTRGWCFSLFLYRHLIVAFGKTRRLINFCRRATAG